MVAGAALDVLEIGTAIADDLQNPNEKFYPKTIATVASIGGRWGGSIAGAKLGAMGGAAIGTMILPGLGTSVGGTVGGLVLGVVGAFSGEAFAEWVIDITEVGE